MSDNYKNLLRAVKMCQTDHLVGLLKKMSVKEKNNLSSRRRSLLDEAASGSNMEVMAILIENGITKWCGLQDSNLIFVGLLQEYYEKKKDGII